MFALRKTTALVLGNFGTQAAIQIKTPSPSVFGFLVDGTTVDTLNILTSPFLAYLDISGCRHSGVLYEYGKMVRSDPDTCLICDDTAVLRVTGCPPVERCQDYNTCVFDYICTVTGPTVIDFLSQVNSVPDRCAYSLLSGPSVPGFHVLGNFRERRRKDVSFVDSVTLQLDGPGVQIQVDQDGRVWLDKNTLTLNSTAQLVHGVELSKDQTGVTAKVVLSNKVLLVFFDGNTAQIHLKGGKDPSLQGLCANSSVPLSSVRLPAAYSASGCEVHYSDSADSLINCTMTTERCNLLNEAPFTACHNYTNPEPYITACTDTMCNYPPADGLHCQFLEAYARACSLYSSNTLEDLMSEAGCSPPQAFCQGKMCNAHEFCAENTGGEPSCFCRAIFATPYISAGTFGDPTICMQNSASVTLVGCLLEEKGFNYSALHLNDQTCTGQVDKQTHMVTFSFNSSNTCGAVVTINNSQIFYMNTIKSQNSSSDVITHQDQVYINFSCFYTQPDVKTVAFRIMDHSVIQQITSGPWNYTVTMKTYTDAGLTQAVESSTEVQLNQKIWVELKTDGLDGGLVTVVTDSCWATNQASPSGRPRYNLIIKGCANPSDRTVQVKGNGLGPSNSFSFNMFRFSSNSGDVYLHCKLNLCVKQNNSCAPICNGGARRRRSARVQYEADSSAFITMAWTK
ncbi:uncharacterized protein LOC119913301 [Micropterus salmoides]|uniref:uncharacterized protein LOC119913301 n=1 Tax=Micropterus salmoides TaxID=27706 RepID=UPI0018EDD93F|nr:uncharacterized protein LOC119913301 [Micropterus salmoides]